MSTRARRTCQHLEALGFVRDLGLSTRDKHVYRHANDPTPLRVFAGLTETTARAIRAKADQIAGLGTAGETPPSSVRDMARIKRAAERARDRMVAEINAARRDPYQRAADDEAIRRAQAAKAAETYAHRREVDALMRPGGRHG